MKDDAHSTCLIRNLSFHFSIHFHLVLALGLGDPFKETSGKGTKNSSNGLQNMAGGTCISASIVRFGGTARGCLSGKCDHAMTLCSPTARLSGGTVTAPNSHLEWTLRMKNITTHSSPLFCFIASHAVRIYRQASIDCIFLFIT